MVMATVTATIAILVMATVITGMEINAIITTGTIITGIGDKTDDENANGSQLKPIG